MTYLTIQMAKDFLPRIERLWKYLILITNRISELHSADSPRSHETKQQEMESHRGDMLYESTQRLLATVKPSEIDSIY